MREGAGEVLAGTIDLRFAGEGLAPGRVNLAYGLYPSWRGRGLANGAFLLASMHAASEGGAEVVIQVDPENPASAAVTQRAGFPLLWVDIGGAHFGLAITAVTVALFAAFGGARWGLIIGGAAAAWFGLVLVVMLLRGRGRWAAVTRACLPPDLRLGRLDGPDAAGMEPRDSRGA
ncbi:GNAT family N-acetyltransferase [Streptomyces sp. NPDC017254]|uniref:GNAT family N-acetyltransferase n=1 Tax=unclassified Streptomyces TaxID=2593676 RepID=UPI00379C5864